MKKYINVWLASAMMLAISLFILNNFINNTIAVSANELSTDITEVVESTENESVETEVATEETTQEPTTVLIGRTEVVVEAKERSSQKVMISLLPVVSATEYEIEISQTEDFGEVLVSKKTTKLYEIISNKKIKNIGTLYVRARAYSDIAYGEWSNAVKVKINKPALGLIKYVKKKIGSPYLYGFKQPYEWNVICTKKDFKRLRKMWGSLVWKSDRKRSVGKYPADCSGLISAYTEIECGSIDYKRQAIKKWKICKKNGRLNIKRLKKIPIGTAVWQEGHIGIFVGWKGDSPYYIAEDGSAYGCRLNSLYNSRFTHALLINDIDYTMSENIKVKVTKKTKFFKNATTKTKKKTKIKKGTELTIVAIKNDRGLVRENSLKQNLWVRLK